MDTKSFVNDAKTSSNMFEWKKEGAANIVIHPSEGFKQRQQVFLPVVSLEKVGKKTAEDISKKPFLSPGIDNNCPFAEFAQYLQDNNDIEDDEIVLKFGESGKAITYCKGDVLGRKGFDFRNSLKLQKQFVFNIIDVDNVEGGIQPHAAQAGEANAIAGLIARMMKKRGDEAGDPTKTPYIIGLTYNKDEKNPQLKFAADALFDEKISDEVQELLDVDGPNLDRLVAPNSPAEIWEALEDGLTDIVDDFTPSFLSGKGSKKEETKPQTRRKVEEPEKPEEEKEELTVDTPKSRRRMIAEPESEPEKEPEEEMEPCMRCGKMFSVNANVCPHCGTKYSLDEDVAPDDAAPEEQDETWVCPKCGTETPQSKSRCVECGKAKPK